MKINGPSSAEMSVHVLGPYPKRSQPPQAAGATAANPITGGAKLHRGSRNLPLLSALALVVLLAACGKKGPPDPPGPPDKVTYPKVYPTK